MNMTVETTLYQRGNVRNSININFVINFNLHSFYTFMIILAIIWQTIQSFEEPTWVDEDTDDEE